MRASRDADLRNGAQRNKYFGTARHGAAAAAAEALFRNRRIAPVGRLRRARRRRFRLPRARPGPAKRATSSGLRPSPTLPSSASASPLGGARGALPNN